MDKAIYLFDKNHYTQEEVDKLTWKDCEKIVAEETYNDDYTIFKIDANGYLSVDNAISGEYAETIAETSYIKSFGF